MRLVLAIALGLSALALLLVLRSGGRSELVPPPGGTARAAHAGSDLQPPPARGATREEVVPGEPPAGAPGERPPQQPPTLVLEGVVLDRGDPSTWSSFPSIRLAVEAGPTEAPGSAVLDPSRTPVCAAQVLARTWDGFERRALGAATTDAAGRWRIEVEEGELPPARIGVEVLAQADGHAPVVRAQPRPFPLPAQLSFEHALPALPLPAGRVLLEDGSPAACARVALQGGDPDEIEEIAEGVRIAKEIHGTALTDERGLYWLAVGGAIVPAGVYRLSARRGELSTELVLPPGLAALPERLPDLVLRESDASFAGRVVAADGVPLPGVRVEARGLPAAAQEDPAQVSAVWTDRFGRFRFRGLPPGARELRVPWDAARVQAEPGGPELLLRLATPCAIVSLADAGGRVLRGPVQAFARHPDRPRDEVGTLRTTLNEAGCAVFPLRPEDAPLELFAESPDGAQARRLVAGGRSQAVRLVVAAPR